MHRGMAGETYKTLGASVAGPAGSVLTMLYVGWWAHYLPPTETTARTFGLEDVTQR